MEQIWFSQEDGIQGDQMLNYKVAQIFTKVASSKHSSLIEKVMLFTLAKFSPCIWATFDRNHVTLNF